MFDSMIDNYIIIDFTNEINILIDNVVIISLQVLFGVFMSDD